MFEYESRRGSYAVEESKQKKRRNEGQVKVRRMVKLAMIFLSLTTKYNFRITIRFFMLCVFPVRPYSCTYFVPLQFSAYSHGMVGSFTMSTEP